MERFGWQGKVAAVEQYAFRFPASGFQHEIGAGAAKRLRRPVDQRLLVAADSQIDGFGPSRARLRCGHGTAPYVYTTNIHVCGYDVNTSRYGFLGWVLQFSF